MTREEAIKKLLEEHCGYGDGDCDRCKFKCEIYMAIEALRERPKGRWVKDGDWLICMECDSEINVKNSLGVENKRNFCPNCGSDNRGEEE